MRRYARRSLAATAAATLLVLAACGDDGGNGSDQPEGEQPPDEITYLTGFGSFGREAFAWVALEKGFFEDENIDATVEAGQGAGDNVAQVVSGSVEFAQADLTGALLQWNEEPQPITAFAAVHQRTLTGIITVEGNGIESPADLEGKTVGDFVPGSVNYLLFPTYAELAGIDADAVNWQNAPPPELAGLLAQDAVDAIGQFMVGQPLVENVTGKSAVTLPYSDYITDLYSGVLITTDQLAEENPDLVQRFTRAMMRGLEYAIDNPDETGEILSKYQEVQPAEVAAAEVRLLAPYVRPQNPGEPIGILDEQRVAQSIAVLEGAGAIPSGITPDDVVSFDLVPSSG